MCVCVRIAKRMCEKETFNKFTFSHNSFVFFAGIIFFSHKKSQKLLFLILYSDLICSQSRLLSIIFFCFLLQSQTPPPSINFDSKVLLHQKFCFNSFKVEYSEIQLSAQCLSQKNNWYHAQKWYQLIGLLLFITMHGCWHKKLGLG